MESVYGILVVSFLPSSTAPALPVVFIPLECFKSSTPFINVQLYNILQLIMSFMQR